MSKLSWFAFEVDAWLRDTACLTHTARSVWINILTMAWNEPERGLYQRPISAFQIEHRLTIDETTSILKELELVANVTHHDDLVTIKSRRMYKHGIALKKHADRQKRYMKKSSNDASVTHEFKSVTDKKLEVRKKEDVNTNGHTHKALVDDPDFMKPIGPGLAPKPLNLALLYLQRNASRRPPREVVSLPEPVQKVLLCFKACQRAPGDNRDDKGWDRVFFKKLAPDAEDLLDVFGGDYRMAVQCMGDLVGELRDKGLKFTLSTIVKHSAEWRYKNVVETSKA